MLMPLRRRKLPLLLFATDRRRPQCLALGRTPLGALPCQRTTQQQLLRTSAVEAPAVPTARRHGGPVEYVIITTRLSS